MTTPEKLGLTALEKLKLSADATVDEIKTRWRELAREHHPDRGGNSVTFNEYRQAYTDAMALATKPRRCEACQGTGKRTESHGFNSIKVICHYCGGKGEHRGS